MGIVLEIINRHVEAIRGLAFFIVAIVLLIPGSKCVREHVTIYVVLH